MYRLLIADDEKAIRESLPKVVPFEEAGFRVCAMAKNGEDALEQTKEEKPDVVLLDVCMPILDGLGYLRMLQETVSKDEMPYIIMLSGYSDFEYARTAIRYGVKAYLTKPVDEDELITVLQDLKKDLDKKQVKQESDVIYSKTLELRKIYHDGDGDTKEYRDFQILHCICLDENSKKQKQKEEGAADKIPDSYSLIRAKLEEKIPGKAAALIRSRGGVLSYLISKEAWSGYQGSPMLFARHLLFQLKNEGLSCALLFDDCVLEKRNGTFRQEYDTNLYRMLAGVFWKVMEIDFASRQKENEDTEKRRKSELLENMRQALLQGQEEGILEAFDELAAVLEVQRQSMLEIQELNFRIYYMLTELLKGRTDEKMKIIRPLDWRELPYFVTAPEWKMQLQDQLLVAYELLQVPMENDSMGAQMLQWCKQHFYEPITLTDVADAFFVSASYAGKCIQKESGKNFKQFLNTYRIEQAKRMLEESDFLVYEIAEKTGFKESKYFVSKFTAEEGTSPMEYRKKFRKE